MDAPLWKKEYFEYKTKTSKAIEPATISLIVCFSICFAFIVIIAIISTLLRCNEVRKDLDTVKCIYKLEMQIQKDEEDEDNQ